MASTDEEPLGGATHAEVEAADVHLLTRPPSGSIVENGIQVARSGGSTTGIIGSMGVEAPGSEAAFPCCLAACAAGDGRRKLCGRWEAAAVWETVIVATLFLSYVALYFCKVHLFVSQADFKRDTGVGAQEYSAMMTAGYATYLLGKLAYGMLADTLGGRACFLLACLGSAGATALLTVWGAGDEVPLTLSWVLLRAAQPAAWVGTVQLSGQWVAQERHGRVLGLLSLSFISGNAFARAVLSLVIAAGASWRGTLAVAACVTASVAPALLCILKPSPEAVGLPPASVGVHGAARLDDSDDDAELDAATMRPRKARRPLRDRLHDLLHNRHFLAVCGLAFMLTAIRETFMTFSSELLQSQTGATDSEAAATSALLPLAGIPAVAVSGWMKDRAAVGLRGGIVTMFLCPLIVALAVLAATPQLSLQVAGALLFVVGFGLLGPYSLLSGVFALDIGGKGDAGLACGLSDAAGFSGAIAMMALSSVASLQGLVAAVLTLSCTALALSAWLWRWLWARQRASRSTRAP